MCTTLTEGTQKTMAVPYKTWKIKWKSWKSWKGCCGGCVSIPLSRESSLTSHAIYDQKKRSTINSHLSTRSRRSSDYPLSPVPSSATLQARLTQMLPPSRLLRNHGYANRQIACPQVQGTKILLLFHGDRSSCPPMRTHTTMATPRACCRRSVRYSEHAISVGERKVRPTFSSTPHGLTYVQSDVSE